MLCLFTILATDLSLACASPSLVTRRNIFNPCFSSWGTISGRGERAQGNTSHTAGKSIACAPPGTSFISKLFPGHIHLVIVKAYFPYQPEQKHGRVIKIEWVLVCHNTLSKIKKIPLQQKIRRPHKERRKEKITTERCKLFGWTYFSLFS